MEKIMQSLSDGVLVPVILAVGGLLASMIADKLGDIYHKAKKEAADRKDRRFSAALKVVAIMVDAMDQAIDKGHIEKDAAMATVLEEAPHRMRELGHAPLERETMREIAEAHLEEKRRYK